MKNRGMIILLCGLGLVSGGIIGWIGHKTLVPQEVITAEPERIKEEISDEDLASLCSELTQEEKANVLVVQKQVKSLQGSLADKEEQLRLLQEEMAQQKKEEKKSSKPSGKKKSQISLEQQQVLEAEIATLRVQLASAEQERDNLRKELKKTLVKLDKQIKETKKFKTKAKKYKRESVENLWQAFVSDSKRKGCDKGSKKRHEACWASFGSALGSSVRERFKTCVNTHQAVPVLRKAGWFERLPPYSKWLNKKDKYTKRWYVIYCDPTLPEARDTDLDDDPPVKPAKKEPVDDEIFPEPDSLPDAEDDNRPKKKKTKWDNLDLDLDEEE